MLILLENASYSQKGDLLYQTRRRRFADQEREESVSEGDEAGIVHVHFFVVFLKINCFWTGEIPATLDSSVEEDAIDILRCLHNTVGYQSANVESNQGSGTTAMMLQLTRQRIVECCPRR